MHLVHNFVAYTDIHFKTGCN